MKIFLDTNVVLDTVIPGRRYEFESSKILSIKNSLEVSICISALSIADIAYILRKVEDHERMMEFVNTLLNRCKILSINDMQLYKALKNLSPDFEDAIQMACAWSECCDCIITGNVQHFKPYTTIPIYTPDEFIRKAGGS